MHRCASDFPKRTTAFLDFLWIEADVNCRKQTKREDDYGLEANFHTFFDPKALREFPSTQSLFRIRVYPRSSAASFLLRPAILPSSRSAS